MKEILIKMSEEVYESIINGKNYISYQEYVEEAIKNGSPQKMGEWIVNKKLGGHIQCSECGAFSGLTEDDLKEGYTTANYCFNCGAKMKKRNI